MTIQCCRYLVDWKWLKQWKKYTGFDDWDQFNAGNESAYPGPIYNANLLKGILCIIILLH